MSDPISLSAKAICCMLFRIRPTSCAKWTFSIMSAIEKCSLNLQPEPKLLLDLHVRFLLQSALSVLSAPQGLPFWEVWPVTQPDTSVLLSGSRETLLGERPEEAILVTVLAQVSHASLETKTQCECDFWVASACQDPALWCWDSFFVPCLSENPVFLHDTSQPLALTGSGKSIQAMKNLLPLWMHGLKQWVMSMLIKTWRTALPLSLSTQQSLLSKPAKPTFW